MRSGVARWEYRSYLPCGQLARGSTRDTSPRYSARARDAALGHLEQIAAAAAPEVGLDVATCLSYFRDNLHFYLGPREQQGLRLFLEHAADLGLVPRQCTANSLRLMVS